MLESPCQAVQMLSQGILSPRMVQVEVVRNLGQDRDSGRVDRQAGVANYLKVDFPAGMVTDHGRSSDGRTHHHIDVTWLLRYDSERG